MANENSQINVDNNNVSMEFETSSTVWKHFTRSIDKNSAVCSLCQKSIRTLGGTTSGLHVHLKSKHNIVIPKDKIKDNGPNTPNLKKIDEFFSTKVKSLEETIARMTAKDGLIFRVFATSEDLRRCLKADGFKPIPTSPNTIRRTMVTYSKKIHEKIKVEIKSELSEGSRFCATFDEWTSCRNRRYVNIILHGKGSKIWNLGLVRCKGSMTADKCLEAVKKKIESFNLSMDRDIVSIMTDGASVMAKIGKLSKSYQQLCFAHGIQLAVIDVLYKKPKRKENDIENETEEMATNESDTESDTESDKEEDEDDECGEIEIDDVGDKYEEKKIEIVDDYKSLIGKTRKIVKMFRRSALKNEILQKYVVSDFNEERQLLLDVKTRWNSLAIMLERFYELRNCVEKALVDIDPDLRLTQEDLQFISDIGKALKPVQLAVEALCRRDANLITADAILIFTFNQLHQQKSDISKDLFEALKNRIKERRSDLSGVLQYLHSNNQDHLHTIHELKPIFDSPSKRKVETVVLNLIKRCHPEQLQFEENAEMETEVELESGSHHCDVRSPPKKKSKSALHIELDSVIDKAMAAISTIFYASSFSQPEKFLLKMIRQELNLFENGGNHGLLLSKAYECLLLIKPTSIESERTFSACGYLCSKIRSRMNDETLHHLCFLRAFFQREDLRFQTSLNKCV